MQILSRSIPIIYLVALVVVAVLFVIDGALINGFDQAFEKWTRALANLYLYMSGFFAAVYAVFTFVQLAMLDLHKDKHLQFDEERNRLVRFVLCTFLLVLPPLALYAYNARYAAQKWQGDGFVSGGSVVYVTGTLFLAAFFLVWSEGRRRDWI